MKKMKKILAMLLAVVMVMGMCVTVMAEEDGASDSLAGKLPKNTDAKAITIENVEEGATYRAYQIIDAAYGPDGEKFIGYVWAPGTGDNAGQKVEFINAGADAVVNGLTDELITALAADPTGLVEKVNYTPETPLEAGTWMILVTPPEENAVKIYNPMIASVYYSVNGSGSMNDLESGTVDAGEDWTLEATGAFAKSSEITIDKDLDNREDDTEISVGDTVSFTITTKIPSYNKNYYKNPVFIIKDEIVNGLAYVETDGKKADPQVYVGGTEKENLVAAGDTTYRIEWKPTTEGKPSFQIIFAASYLTGLADKEVEARNVTVKYSTTITEEAVNRVGENKASLEFSRTPDKTDTKEDKEYIFTFAIHGMFYKEDDKGQKLPDATFTLYVADNEGEETIQWAEGETVAVSEVDHYETGADGEIKFKGLDGDKTYYLRETEAPKGYSINDTIYKVVFTFEKPENYKGEDITYTVTVTNNKDNENKTSTVTYGKAVTIEGETYGNAAMGDKINIPNTKISSLPSTGGIGTTIFTIGGCTIMIIAAGLFFATRRKTEK